MAESTTIVPGRRVAEQRTGRAVHYVAPAGYPARVALAGAMRDVEADSPSSFRNSMSLVVHSHGLCQVTETTRVQPFPEEARPLDRQALASDASITGSTKH